MEVLTMTWTQERITLLIDLWMSGKSASIVAKELGNISRNAVIGKVHRLGIANRTNLKKTVAKTTKNNSEKIILKSTRPQKSSPKRNPAFNIAVKDTGGKIRVQTKREPHPPRKYNKSHVLNRDPNAPTQFKNLSLLELTENSCRWPSGDPQDSNFHFCGCPAEPNSSYCSYHAQVAYTQTSRRDTKQYIIVDQKPPRSQYDNNDNINIEMGTLNQENSDNIQYL